jgi:MFS family permease
MRSTIGAGTLVVGLGDLALALPSLATASWPALLPGLVVTGIGAGLVSPVLPAAAMAAAPAQFSGVAAGTTNCARQLGLALGVAVLGSVYHQHNDGLPTVFAVATATGLITGGAALALLGSRRILATPAQGNPQQATAGPPV